MHFTQLKTETGTTHPTPHGEIGSKIARVILGEVFLMIWCVIKGYQECNFKVETGDIFTAVKKIGDYGRAFKVVDSK